MANQVDVNAAGKDGRFGTSMHVEKTTALDAEAFDPKNAKPKVQHKQGPVSEEQRFVSTGEQIEFEYDTQKSSTLYLALACVCHRFPCADMCLFHGCWLQPKWLQALSLIHI